MEPLNALLKLHESDDPPKAFRAVAEALAESIPLRCALRVSVAERAVSDSWPKATEISPELIDTVVHVLRPEIFRLGSELPTDAVNFPGAEMLLLPLRHRQTDAVTTVLIADNGSFGQDLQPWGQLASAFERFEERHRRIERAETECEDLRQRVEESEALHTLGLAANRTLDPDEVLSLVARFTRTLLGAHYVTVSTVGGNGQTVTVASVGLRSAHLTEDYLFARRVVEAEKPLTVGTDDANFAPEEFPFHVAEGMRSGLGIPLSLFGDTFGALIIGYRQEYPLAPRDTRLALTLAGHAAVAISNARLHAAVEERSHELEKAYDELRRVSLAKERFFASVNHELRTPLSAIMGYQNLLSDGTAGELPAKAQEYLSKANRGAQNLLLLVNDLLDLSKIAAGKMEVDLQAWPVSVLLDEAFTTIQPLADAKGIPLVISSDDGLPQIRADLKRACQVLVNLLSNAIKFTDAGEVAITATHAAHGADGGSGESIEIRVADTGPGIAPENLELVFEEFEQVKGTHGGTGLGLPISRRLARMMGGELSLESEPGVGSTFVLSIPVASSTDVGRP